MPLVEKTAGTHDTEGRGNQLGQFQVGFETDSEKLMSTHFQQIQELEQFFFELTNLRTVAISVGVQLDGVGGIIGEGRNGRADTEYRRAISAKVLINKSSGTREQMLEIVKLLIPQNRQLTATEDSFPAHFEITVTPNVDALPAEIISQAVETYALVNGDTIDVDVDGGGVQTVTFLTADFADIANATAAEVAAVIGLALAGGASVDREGRVVINTAISVEVTGGTANAVLSYPAGVNTSEQANQAVMQRVAAAMQTAKANSVRGILLWSTSATSFGFLGTPGALGFGAGAFASAS